MQKRYNLRRDPLDYFLTDTLPIEIPELYTHTYFYDYLHDNEKSLDSLRKMLQTQKNGFTKKIILFDGGKWSTTPLKYDIVKNDGISQRKMSLPQPLSALNMHLFISLYESEILNYLNSSNYSVRRHTRNNDLVYKQKGGVALIEYLYKRNRKSKKVIEQTGRYFDIGPYDRILDLERSEKWIQANIRYKSFCQLDYKRCFDSVYSHVYTWIVTKDVVDSKKFKNSSLYATVDRILQNINGKSSNGAIVGPEFSRLIVEILLQRIDEDVQNALINKDIVLGRDYELMRFVDDMFIFSANEEIEDEILRTIDTCSAKYILEINKLKTKRQKTPYVRAQWISDVEKYRDGVTSVFRSNSEISRSENTYQIKCRYETMRDLKIGFQQLVSKHRSNDITVANYLLTVAVTAMSSKKRTYTFFKTPTHKSVYLCIDYIFYLYSHAVSFQNTQKIISILHYINAEVGIKGSSDLQSIIKKYQDKIFARNGMDYVNLLITFRELDIEVGSHIEELIFDRIIKEDDPLLLASFVYYSLYNNKLHEDVMRDVNTLILKKIQNIQTISSALLYREFWYVIIFNNCPYISVYAQNKCIEILKKCQIASPSESGDYALNMLLDFMLKRSEKNTFISWNTKGARVMEEITFRTYRRTVFKSGVSTMEASF